MVHLHLALESELEHSDTSVSTMAIYCPWITSASGPSNPLHCHKPHEDVTEYLATLSDHYIRHLGSG
jgi:hypothetical protein